ncbi:helix-turn-helix transcriptional regulator [Patescibacteria group bacterium]|nr:helix-turn-helix transcriptional regulator [Patescibacteria group bacterium]
MSTSKAITQQFTTNAKLLGDTWILIIIKVLENKPLRFSEIERGASDICPVTLTDRLKKLEQGGIVRRYKETVDKLSVVYELTDKGREILPILKLIEAFSQN